MGPLDYLEIDRLLLIPENYWARHEFCFYLHDTLMQVARDYETQGAHLQVDDMIRTIILKNYPQTKGINILDLLKGENLEEPYQLHIIGHTVLALLNDMHQFLYSSLGAFEARRFSVGFSLLRKVFKEHLIFLCWILCDEKDFIERFEGDVYKTLNNLSKEKRIDILNGAIKSIELSEMFDPEAIWFYVFDKNYEGGFESVWQMATHLVTSQGLIKTGEYSLNFAFEDRNDDFYFDILYDKLPYLMIFLVQVSMRALSKICQMDARLTGRFIISTVVAYEALCMKGKSHMAGFIRDFFKEFLHCMYCGEKIRLTKAKRARLFVSQLVECQACKADNQFPLNWLMAKANFTVKDNGEIGSTKEM